jgi:hypothetical protein
VSISDLGFRVIAVFEEATPERAAISSHVYNAVKWRPAFAKQGKANTKGIDPRALGHRSGVKRLEINAVPEVAPENCPKATPFLGVESPPVIHHR